MNPILINGLHKNSTKIGPGMISFNVHKAELLTLKLPVLWMFLGGRNVVTSHWEIWVSSIRCPGIKCRRNLSRYILCNFVISIELHSEWVFTFKASEILFSNIFACESIWAWSLVWWGISFSARAGHRYVRRQQKGILLIKWKAYQWPLEISMNKIKLMVKITSSSETISSII